MFTLQWRMGEQYYRHSTAQLVLVHSNNMKKSALILSSQLSDLHCCTCVTMETESNAQTARDGHFLLLSQGFHLPSVFHLHTFIHKCGVRRALFAGFL